MLRMLGRPKNDTYEEDVGDESAASCTLITRSGDLEAESRLTTIHTMPDRCYKCDEKIPCTQPIFQVEPAVKEASANCRSDEILCDMCYKGNFFEQMKEQYIQRADDISLTHLASECSQYKAECGEREVKRFCCVTHCSEVFNNEAELLIHVQQVHADKVRRNQEIQELERPFKCNICFRAFFSAKNLRIHKYIRLYQNNKISICSKCPFMAASKAELNVHERSHTDERPFPCNKCEKRFYSKVNLKSHQVCHRTERPFSCPHCPKSFSRKRNMNEHINSCHSNEKPFHCDNCSASFKTLQHLRLHCRLHTGEKPYTCSVCSRSFYHISDHKRHELWHTGEKPYSCSTCGASYTRKHSLTLHERIHTGDRPFGCDDCGKRFTQVSLLKRHVVRHKC